jgi:uncharacterized protein YndB with AHSA1/START domain
MNNNDYGQYTQRGEVQFTRLLPGPIERVWTYITDSEKRGTWLAKGPMDLRKGGAVHLTFHHADFAPDEPNSATGCGTSEDGQAPEMRGTILRCEPPHLLSFEWTNAEKSEVTFELTERGKDVQLILTHRRLVSRDLIKGVSGGWHAHVAIMIAELSGAPVPPFWSTKEKLDGEYEARLQAAFPG